MGGLPLAWNPAAIDEDEEDHEERDHGRDATGDVEERYGVAPASLLFHGSLPSRTGRAD